MLVLEHIPLWTRCQCHEASQSCSHSPSALDCMLPVWTCPPVSSLHPFQDWSYGFVFINGRNLGRYWNIGPQQTLYLPGAWLHPEDNEVRRPHPCLYASHIFRSAFIPRVHITASFSSCIGQAYQLSLWALLFFLDHCVWKKQEWFVHPNYR